MCNTSVRKTGSTGLALLLALLHVLTALTVSHGSSALLVAADIPMGFHDSGDNDNEIEEDVH
ncbi:unnamed protein product, partial [Allacma fusca]